jgi:hypothetical protein
LVVGEIPPPVAHRSPGGPTREGGSGFRRT